MEDARPTSRDLVRWSESLAGIARTGLGFTQSLYERERFEEVLRVAADIRVAAGVEARAAARAAGPAGAQTGPGEPAGPSAGEAPFSGGPVEDAPTVVRDWLATVGHGVPGYVTPKVAVGAVVGNDRHELLLIQRADSGAWLYPTGWADVGYSASELAVKEVREETGIDAEPVRLIGLLDGLRLGFNRIPLYSLVFHCRAVGGRLVAHPLECADVGWFAEDSLPSPLIGADHWVAHAFAALRGEPVQVLFDQPRRPPWRDAEPSSLREG
ncbi:MAG: NUDIX hydrolase N-terminal domain-containing protein [Acidimicrobiales bacterium]